MSGQTSPFHKLEIAERPIAGPKRAADYRLGDGATGVDAIEALCAHIDRSVHAVIVTGDTSPSRIKDATASGHRILHKPITSEDRRSLR